MPKKPEKKFVTICPICNSSDVGVDFSNPALVSTGLFNNARVCHNCGHSANFFPEAEADNLPKVKILKKEDKRDLVNTTYGKNINLWWKISGPIGIALSLIFIAFFDIKFLFYLGLVGLLPLSCILTLISHRNDLLQKHPFLRAISILVFIYIVTIAPVIIVYLAGLF